MPDRGKRKREEVRDKDEEEEIKEYIKMALESTESAVDDKVRSKLSSWFKDRSRSFIDYTFLDARDGQLAEIQIIFRSLDDSHRPETNYQRILNR